MARVLSTVTLVSFALLAGACKERAPAAPTPAPSEPRATPPKDAPAETGRNTYLTACANCHGKDGRGDALREQYPKLPDLTLPSVQDALPEARLRVVILEGHSDMPEFDSLLTDDQVTRLIGYVRALRADK